MTSRRGLGLAALLALAGSLLVLLAASRSWVTWHEPLGLGLPTVDHGVRGGRLSTGAQAMALLGLASVAALLAVRGVLRRLLGLVVLAAGVVVVVQSVRVAARGLSQQADHLGLLGACSHGLGSCPPHTTSPVWLVVMLLGGLLLAASGLLTAMRGGAWSGLGSSYEPPTATPVEAPVTDKSVWDALDRGDDPTA